MKKESLELGKVLGYQRDVSAIIKTISDLEAAIEAHQSIIHEANSAANSNNLPGLMTRREDFLADMAAKGASADDLAELDSQIAEEKARLEKFNAQSAETVADANQAIAGLSRKLEGAKAEYTQLIIKRESVLTAYLVAEAETVGEEYIQLGRQLVTKYGRILAINQLLRNLQPVPAGNRFISDSFRRALDLIIPVFQGLQSHNGTSEKASVELKESSQIRNLRAVVKAGIDEEIENMVALGIEWE